jgi:DNA primase
VPVIDYYLAKVEKDFDLASAAGKKNAVEEMLPLIKSVADPVEREHYLNRLSELTATSLSSIVEKAGIAPKAMLARGLNKAASQQPTLYMRELALLRALIEYFPRSLEVASSDGQAASASDFFDDTNRMVFQSLKSAFMEWRGLDEIGDELDEGVFRIYQSLRAAIAASQVEIETDPAQADTAIKFELDKLRKMNFRKVYLELVDEIKKLQADDPLVVELAESALQINQLQKLYP